MTLNANDIIYKDAMVQLVSFGQNRKSLQYGTSTLSVNPWHNHLGETSSTNRSESTENFFERWEVRIGRYAVEEGLPETAISKGEQWTFGDDDVFILKHPIETGMWWVTIMARFLSEVNLTVDYSVGQGTYSTQDGNPVEDTTPAQFTATVSQQSRPNTEELPGVPVSAIYLEGYHRSPSAAPEVIYSQRMTASLISGVKTIAGEFVLLPSVQSSTPGTTAGAGEFLRGYFIMEGT